MPPRSPRESDARERVLRGIAVAVTAVWVITTLVQVIDPDRQVPETVNYIFGIIVSSLFGVSVIRSRKGNGNGNGKNGGGEPHA